MTQIRRQLFRSFLLMLLAVASASARAADDYLKVIPSTALAWGVVNHIGEATDKIQKVVAVLPMPPASVLEQIKMEYGLQKGLDEKGAVGFFMMPGKTEKETATVTFVAVADEKAFRGNFEVVKAGEKISEVKPKPQEVKPAAPGVPQPMPTTRSTATVCLAFRNGYALLSAKSDRAAVEAGVEARQSIAAEMAGLESWLAENDGTVVGTAAGIKYAARQAGEELKKSKDGGANRKRKCRKWRSILPSWVFTARPSRLRRASSRW